jgi:hypothetical protein
MSTDTFRRHARVRVDAVIRRAFAFRESFVRDPFPVSRPCGHPLVIVHAFTQHVFGTYPTPRFLASAWFTDNALHQRWFIAIAQGASLRSLNLPIALTRRMGHLFLATPDHYSIVHALRRAELLALGASPALVTAVLATRLGSDLSDWRRRLTWLACVEDLDLDQVGPIIDFLHAHAELDLRGRTYASVMRLVEEWHAWLAKQRGNLVTWKPTRWHGLTIPIPATRRQPRASEWTIHELTDSREVLLEGRAMRHCVASYVRYCRSGSSSIWSLRFRWLDEEHARSILTIEVYPALRRVGQIRGPHNSRASPAHHDLVRQWATSQNLRMA